MSYFYNYYLMCIFYILAIHLTTKVASVLT